MIKEKGSEYRVVYSTEQGAVCPECQRAQERCSCRERERSKVRGDGNVKVQRETAGRAGKTVTTVQGVAMNTQDLEGLLKELKRICGAGGALKEGVLEVQGDHCEVILRELLRRGMRARRVGG